MEKAGLPAEAVEVYFEAGNLADARYLMDIIMTKEQVEKLAKQINAKYRDEVYYALGSKHMLELDVKRAREAFLAISKTPAKLKQDEIHDLGTETARMLEVTAELDTLLQAEKNAVSEEEKAVASYAIGAYLYHKNNRNTNRHAILNNVMISSSDSPVNAYNLILPDEKELRQKRFDRANLLLRAEEYFLKAASTKSSVAPKALYSAALCRLWLPTYHSYYQVQTNFNPSSDVQKAIGYLTQLLQKYPKHSLAKEASKVITNLKNIDYSNY
ncbi:MAG: hypothetical protein RMM17_11875 [Acidobacteriota bacterium]|nr:hypothetical protein [Blastocatellia bacterium]MDW8413371.1 hypothetical protein [Acidobacteriota bacterium]